MLPLLNNVMKHLATRGCSILFVALLAACQTGPRFINHPRPDLAITFDVFQDAGCPADQYGYRPCNSNSPLYALGCNEIQVPSDLLGGLHPSHPIAMCLVSRDNMTESQIAAAQFLYYTGGLAGSFLRYVIHQNDEFTLVQSEEEFREIFAPVETPEEALSYVLAVKNLSAYYGLENDPAVEYEVDVIEDTHVVAEADGYRLHLYTYQLFGCGPHWVSAVEIHVSSEGVIQELSQTPVFRNPDEDGLCVD